jgi:hypothetical protein
VIPTIKHNEHEVSYHEDDNSWRCPSLSVEASSLAALRAKINKIDADARRINVSVLVRDYSGWNAAQATLFEGDRSVWVSQGKSRRKEAVSGVIFDTPENRAIISEVNKEVARLQAEVKDQQSRLGALPRVTMASLIAAGAETAQ